AVMGHDGMAPRHPVLGISMDVVGIRSGALHRHSADGCLDRGLRIVISGNGGEYHHCLWQAAEEESLDRRSGCGDPDGEVSAGSWRKAFECSGPGPARSNQYLA